VGSGIEAVLPANAAATKQSVNLNAVSCASAGDCSAVGTYVDSSGNTAGLLLTETAGSWAAGIAAVLPANAAAGTNSAVSIGSVSCSSAGDCSAVGSYVDSSGNNEGLLLTQSAGSWAAGVEATLPANAATIFQAVALTSVSCPSAGTCSTVGTYLVSTGSNSLASQGLLVTETSGRWTSGADAALPPNADPNRNAVLSSVSCPSSGNCSAVGTYEDSSGNGHGLFVTETAGRWTTGAEAALPSNAAAPDGDAVLSSVSCASQGNCSAVGYYFDNSNDLQGLLLTETAGGWATGVEAALPANAATTFQAVALTSVSCPAPGNCTTVGSYFDNTSDVQGLLLTENGGRWMPAAETVLPADAVTIQKSVVLNSVWCASPGNCTVVGNYDQVRKGSQGLLLSEAAGSWASGVQAALPPNAHTNVYGADLTSVSCPSAKDCTGVGNYESSSSGVQGLLMTIDPPPLVTLNISKHGKGCGAVHSSPAGLSCGTACSHAYPARTRVTLTATPAAASSFAGWAGACTGTGKCVIAMHRDRTATATFNFISKACVVPELKGRTLATAKRSIKSYHCTVGKIRRATSRRIEKNHVISQQPKPGRHLRRGAKVNLVISKGP
jgi:PASTA domain-containing protein/List-Bact-rpt repeat protein